MLEINNLTDGLIHQELLDKACSLVFRQEGVEPKQELSIVLVISQEMRKINKRYKGEDKITDVLSFSTPGKKYIIGQEAPILGEIVICPEKVRKNAKMQKHSYEQELASCLIHGILHLLGYDHKQQDQRRIMEEKQDKYILNLFQK